MRPKRLFTLASAFALTCALLCVPAHASGLGEALRAYPPAMAMLIFCAACPVVLLLLTKPLGRLERLHTEKAMVRAFVVLFALNGIVCLVMAMLSDGESWSHMMHVNPASREPTQFEFFFKNVRTAARGEYGDLNGQFPPMSIFIWRLIGKCFPLRYIENDNYDYYVLMIKNKVCMMIYLFLVLFMSMISYLISQKKIRENGLISWNELVLFMLFFSFPVMYTVELGSLTGVSFVFTLFYVLYKDHDFRPVRILSDALLALAAAMSVVALPFVFLLAVEGKKDRPRMLRVAGFAAAFFVLPAFLTGFDGLGRFLGGFFDIPANGIAATNLSLTGLVYRLGLTSRVGLFAVFMVCELTGLAAVFMTRRPWLRALACAFMAMNVPAWETADTSIFLVIPLLLLLAEKEHDAADWWGLLLMSCAILPIPEWYYYAPEKMAAVFGALGTEYVFGPNHLAIPAALAAVWVLLIIKLFPEKETARKGAA